MKKSLNVWWAVMCLSMGCSVNDSVPKVDSMPSTSQDMREVAQPVDMLDMCTGVCAQVDLPDAFMQPAVDESADVTPDEPISCQGWTHQDVGDVVAPGAYTCTGEGEHTLSGSGEDIWGEADAFHFVHRQMSGDFVFVARLDDFEATQEWAKAGLMARAGLDSGSPHIHMLATQGAERPVKLEWRVEQAGVSEGVSGPVFATPHWMRLTRVEDTFHGDISPDGASWTRVSSRVLMLPEELEVGMAVTSSSQTQDLAVSTWTQVSVQPVLAECASSETCPGGTECEQGSCVSSRSNPDVELLREITFEQADGTNGWQDPDGLLFNWREHALGRDRVPDAMLRGATGINVPDVASDISYRGRHSARFVMKPWGGSSNSFRTDLEMVGNKNAQPPVERYFSQGDTHVVGFAMRIGHATWAKSGFQLFHQYHNSNPARAGWGSSLNPALSLIRSSENDDDLLVIARHNRPNGERGSQTIQIPNGVRAGQWVRWVFKTRFLPYGSDEPGFVEVWSAVDDGPLVMHGRVEGPMGYVYEDPSHAYETVQFDCYGTPFQEDAVVHLDEVRIVDGDLPASVVDPLSWVTYVHPLNQPHNQDLSRP